MNADLWFLHVTFCPQCLWKQTRSSFILHPWNTVSLHPPLRTPTFTEAATATPLSAHQLGCSRQSLPLSQPPTGEPAVCSASRPHQLLRCSLQHRAKVSSGFVRPVAVGSAVFHLDLKQTERTSWNLCLSPSRFQRQLSDPCLPFLPPEKTTNTAYHPSACDGRPLYQRHLSEPLVPVAARGFKQELVDPRYQASGPPGPGLPRPQTTFNHVKIKQEPRDFGFEPGVCVWMSLIEHTVILCWNNGRKTDLCFHSCFSRGSNLPDILQQVFGSVSEELCWWVFKILLLKLCCGPPQPELFHSPFRVWVWARASFVLGWHLCCSRETGRWDAATDNVHIDFDGQANTGLRRLKEAHF